VEECDDRNNIQTDGCLNDCSAAQCGDGFVEAGVEACDDGNNDRTDACLNDCTVASCGDGNVQVGVEDCDDQNDLQTDACLNDCTQSSCGDGHIQAGVEACDDANQVNNDRCSNQCEILEPLGSVADRAGTSCYAIKQARNDAADGTYWVDPNPGDNEAARQLYCDMTRDGGGWTLVGVARFDQRGQAGWNNEAHLNIERSNSQSLHWHLSSAWIDSLVDRQEFRANCFESSNNFIRYWWGVTAYRWGSLTSASETWDNYTRDGGGRYATSWSGGHYGLVSGSNETFTLITAHGGNHWACGGSSAAGGEGFTGRNGVSNMRIWAK
jgi:cysteine-rich repeat protein